MAETFITLPLPYDIQTCSARLQAIASQLNAQIKPINCDDDVPEEERFDIEVCLEGKASSGLFGGGKLWAVRTLASANGAGCTIVIDPFGDPSSRRGPYSFKHAMEKRDQIGEMLLP